MGLRIGGITFSGISSGFPTDQIIEQLLELEQRPIDALEGRKASFEEKLAIFQDLNTRMLALRDALRHLDNMNLLGTDQAAEEEFRRYAATSSNSTIATATSASTATPGSLVIEVTQLATQERNISNGYSAATASVGTGTFSIQIGTGPTTDITIDSSNESVEGFVAAVNSADAGVTAFVVDDGGASNPFKIILVGNDTGAANTITITDTLVGRGVAARVQRDASRGGRHHRARPRLSRCAHDQQLDEHVQRVHPRAHPAGREGEHRARHDRGGAGSRRGGRRDLRPGVRLQRT